MSITTGGAGAFMRSPAKDLSAWSNKMTRTLSANIPSRVGVRTGIFFGTSSYVGVSASGLEPARTWNYGVPE